MGLRNGESGNGNSRSRESIKREPENREYRKKAPGIGIGKLGSGQ